MRVSGPDREPDRPEAKAARDRARSRARLAEIFGDVLPDTTGDERDLDVRRDGEGDGWLRAQVPPHHG